MRTIYPPTLLSYYAEFSAQEQSFRFILKPLVNTPIDMTDRISEKHFADFCRGLGFVINKIKRTNQPTADFEVRTPEISLIAEVKELTGGANAVALLEKFAEERSISLSSKPGRLAETQIKNASIQVASSAHSQPAIVVLYSNISREKLPAIMPDEHVSHEDIDAAMYGDLTVYVSLGRQSNGGPCYNIPKNGESLASRHRHISAIAVLSSFTNKHLNIYHNRYAKSPLRITSFRGPGVRHYFKDEKGEKQLAGWMHVEE